MANSLDDEFGGFEVTKIYSYLVFLKILFSFLKEAPSIENIPIKSEIPKHCTRQNNRFNQNVQFWENQIEQFKKFFQLRESTAYQHIKSAFELTGQLKPLHISTNIKNLKGFKLRHSSYPLNFIRAQFFSGIPIEMEALTRFAKYRFKNWSIQPNDTSRFCNIDVAAPVTEPTIGIELTASTNEISPYATLYWKFIVSGI